MRIKKNVYQLLGNLYGSHQNVYAVDCGNSIVIVDTGKDRYDWDKINQNLRYWELDFKPVSHVLLTHAHYEHSGNASRFEAFGASVICHPLCAQAIMTGDDRTASYAFDLPNFSVCHRSKEVSDGETISIGSAIIKVIYVPGHSDDSLAWFLELDGLRILFSGDTVLIGDQCQNSRLGWTGAVDYNQKKYIESLAKLSMVEADCILPGHGEICLERGDRVLVGAYQKARLELATQPSRNFADENLFR